MSDPEPVHFFDIKSSLEGSLQSWSPNTVKIRILLNYRNILYTQQYVSYPDIESLLKGLDVPARPPGHCDYVLPAITHPSIVSTSSLDSSSPTSGTMNESWDIALHLERAFPPSPTHPSIFPTPSSFALARVTQQLVSYVVISKCYDLVACKVPSILDERGREFFRRTREEQEGMPVEGLAGDEKNQVKLWHHFEKSLQPFLHILRGPRPFETTETEEEVRGPFLEGKQFGYSDAILVGIFVWFHRGNREGWERIMKLGGGGEFQRMWDASAEWIEGQGVEKEWKVKG